MAGYSLFVLKVSLDTSQPYLHFTSDKGGGNVFAHVCLSICLLARLLKNACVDLGEMLHVDRCWDMDELVNF